ncbi:PucR family transcriptional regulator [Nocardia africana]|uniref:Sugar diacid utilization regulator n=1 Tax=Nocardia africana TaxID=134964 RepID=A0A378X4V6_9NOCA|nr:PucR family transcriptional regulator [Nocardia africana]MCC3317137.1 helix-turn-helix domain-containing protein [Nocardia africana]SUA47865.1 Sugar diacid utilization regulator [Nocardia africana]
MPVAVNSAPSSLAARILDRLPQFAERVLASGLGISASAVDLPADHFVEVLPAIYGCAHAFLHAMAQQREFTRDEVATFVQPVIERHAEDRLPLPLLMEAVHRSAQQVLQEAVAVSGPAEVDQLIEFGSRTLELLMHINLITVEGYAAIEHSIYHPEREARRALCAALVGGQSAEEQAARADTALAEHYSVLAVQVRTDPQPAAAANLVVRRRIRILQRVLDRVSGPTALHTFDGETAVVLLPGVRGWPETGAELATELAEQFGADVVVAETPGTRRESVPEAAHQAAEVAQLARMSGRPTGVYRLDDLLLEYQLTRPGVARDRLAERIEPLHRAPHLMETLDAHLRHGSDRKAAAAEIHVHPNTFSYRLRRIGELTGADPSDPNGSRLLSAALVAHRLSPAPARPVTT